MYDTIILGSGPAGLSAAVYAKRSQLDFVITEKDYNGTGQIAESECVDNYLGLNGENGFELGEKFRKHALALGVEFLVGNAVKINPVKDFYQVVFSDDKTLETKTVIYATGASHRKLGIKGENEFTGRGVSYCAVCDGAFYRGKTVAVVGGGDTALGDAILLSKIAAKVYLIHRRDEFRANKLLQNKVSENPVIECVLNAVPTEIDGDKKVSGISIMQNNTEKTIAVDGVFVAIGNVPNSELLKGVADLDSNGYVIADENGVTSAKGIFVAGDVRTKQLRQVVTAVSDGANCVMSAENYLMGFNS
ncbi:MAG: thioredoxin-disulfide reductase [Clostridia bacterium]|nr:thioredoxin-disulfide reductase [Clostridia bacterium]